MATVSIDCANCATTAHMPTTTVFVDLDGPGDDESAGTVSWICDTCADVVSQPVKWSVLLPLVSAGAALFDGYDDELSVHPESPPGGPPLTRDDLLDLHAVLDGPSWFGELERALGLSPENHQR